MKQKKQFWLIRSAHILPMVLCVALCIPFYFLDQRVFWIVSPITLAVVICCVYRSWGFQKDIYKTVAAAWEAMTDTNGSSLLNFPLSCMIVGEEGEIIWYNDKLRENVLKKKNDIFGNDVNAVFKTTAEDILKQQGKLISYDGRHYEAYCLKTQKHDAPMYLIYLVDVTSFQKIKTEADSKKPVVLLILIDNYEETVGDENESSKAKMLSEVRGAIQDFVGQTTGFIRRYEQDRYLVVMEKSSFDKVVKSRFNLLDKVRAFATNGRTPITLSIGAAEVNDTLAKAEQEARQALDMALGRGGDQAAVKSDVGYEFFGGFSKGVEKHTKVKTRIVASALLELIRASDNILVMGHSYADLDSLGASIGMAKACRCFEKPVHIVLDENRNLAGVLTQRLREHEQENLLCSPEEAMDEIGEKTLLIILDTHTETLLESREVYRRCKQVVVIDHHRMLVNHIEDAVIFYHESYASSASEMVTELIPYFGDKCKLCGWEAEALLAGIMLDTKNFVVKTGVRTFEAAAYLRRLGADTVGVRQLFASSMDSYRRKAKIVSAAEIYKSCAISVCDFYSDDLRVVAPQAADELLDIEGVKASFVLYNENESTNISARSMGEFNVQLVMEKMGGGGHQTMAGVQMANMSCMDAKSILLSQIDKQEEDSGKAVS